MAGWMDKFKDAALKIGRAGQQDPRLAKAAQNIKDVVESFREGYRQQVQPSTETVKCTKCLKNAPNGAKYCPYCGEKLDSAK
ncbi:MAG: zinc ribbon domain-containing protein [Thermodesulfobacteriota bacterium]